MSDVVPPKPGATGQAVQRVADTYHGTADQGRNFVKPVSPAAPAGTPTSNPPAPAVSLAASLIKLVEGARLEGKVIGRAAPGMVLIRTNSAVFEAATDQPMPRDAKLVLQVLKTGPPLRVALLSQDGAALHPPRTMALEIVQGRAEQVQSLPPAGQNVPGRAPLPQLGQPAQQPHAPAGQPQPLPGKPPASLPAGTRGVQALLQLGRVEAVVLPQPGGERPLVSSLADLVPRTIGQAWKPLLPNTQLVLRVVDVQPPAQNQATTAGTTLRALWRASQEMVGSQPPDRLTGTVVRAETPSGPAPRVVVKTPVGNLAVASNADLPPGTRLTIEVVETRPPPAPLPTGPIDPLAARELIMRLGNDWEAMRRAIAELARQDPAVARQITNQVLPNLGPRLTSASLFFFSALNAGDLTGWLGRGAAQMLENAGRSDLLSRLVDDFAQLGRLGSEPVAGDWRAILMPLWDGQQLHMLRLFSKQQQGGGEAEGEDGEGTRFVIELDLSRLGPMQLDGLLHRRNLDLILRTRRPLVDTMRRDITGIYQASLETTGMDGNLVFETADTFPISPTRDLNQATAGQALTV